MASGTDGRSFWELRATFADLSIAALPYAIPGIPNSCSLGLFMSFTSSSSSKRAPSLVLQTYGNGLIQTYGVGLIHGVDFIFL